MQVDPVRTQRLMLMVGGMVAVLVVVGALVVGWLRPAGTVGTAKIVADRKLGTIFVRVDGRLHPALNLVSARLVAGEAVEPTFVSPQELAKWPRGPLVGIVGAPMETPVVLAPQVSRWALCDTAGESLGSRPVVTGINGELTLGDHAKVLAADEAVIGSFAGQTFVISGGLRMPVDPSDRAVTGPLGIAESTSAVPLTQAMVDAIPAGRALVVPHVPGAGEPTALNLGVPAVIGSVVVAQDVASSKDQFYVVLGDGVQPVSAVVAAMIRQKDSFGAPKPPRVSPDRLDGVAIREVLDVKSYPPEPVKGIEHHANPVLCVSWERGVADRQARQRLVVGRGLPIRAEQNSQLVKLVVGAGTPEVADQVLLADSPATFVSTTGARLDSQRRETMWLISESGARYGVPYDEPALKALGLDIDSLRLAPWPLLRVWPAGPELSRAAAMTMHDTLAGPAAAVTIQQER